MTGPNRSYQPRADKADRRLNFWIVAAVVLGLIFTVFVANKAIPQAAHDAANFGSNG